MPQPVTASTSTPASNDTSASAGRPRDSTSSFQDTLNRVQGSQSANSTATNAPSQQPVPGGTQKKNGKDDRQKSSPSAESANKPDEAAKSEKAPAKTNERTSDGQGRQRPPQKQQQEPQPAPSTAQSAMTPPQPVPATPQTSPPESAQRKTPPPQRPRAEAIAPTPDSRNSAQGSATQQDVQPVDPSQSPATSPASSQDLQPQQDPQDLGAEPEEAPNPRPGLRPNASGEVPKAIKPVKQTAAALQPAADSSTTTGSTNPVAADPSTDQAPSSSKSSPDDILAKIGMTSSVLQTRAAADPHSSMAPAKAVPLPPEAQFAEANHPKLIEAIHGRLLPEGGTMTLRLDPPELGAMNVRVEVRDGVINASFEASNDQTARLLSHSLGDLKTALEAQGVSVEKLHVSQAPKDQSSSQNQSRQDSDRGTQDRSTQQEQQRREMMRRMWRRLMKAQDPLDLVA